MISSPKISFLPVAIALVTMLSGCATTPAGPVHITKVNPYHYQYGDEFVRTDDQMIRFEHRRIYHGAVDGKELEAREGNYYSVFWKSKNRAPATVRFEYRSANTGPQIHLKEIHVSAPKKSNVTKFEVIGQEYETKGKVTQWKASVIENGAVVAEFKSFLWK